MVLQKWRAYSDTSAVIFAETDGIQHNTVTPIARKNSDTYVCDIVLRNNLTTKDRPLGLFHPNPTLHHIKKENIGLIEVMGLAVLPARLKEEIAVMREFIIAGKDLASDERIEKHKDWFLRFKDNYEFTEENTEDILKEEIGKTFQRVLEDAGVYKNTESGRNAFLRFIATIR